METKTRILIADPNQDFCRLISETFGREADLEVVGTASDGVEALSLLAELKPDVLLMDLVLPKLDGLELLSMLTAALAPGASDSPTTNPVSPSSP